MLFIPNYKHAQQGVVIVLALFVTALVAAISYFMMTELQRDIRRTTLIVRHTQAEYYAEGALSFAKDRLRENWEKQQAKQLIDVIPIIFPLLSIKGYEIKTIIYDMQARFNLNNLTQEEAQKDFKRLLHISLPQLTLEDREKLLAAIKNWMSGNGRNLQEEQQVSAADRLAHQEVAFSTELLSVKGMTPAVFAALRPLISALPAGTLINVQTAGQAVLMSLSDTVDLAAAAALIQLRQKQAITSLPEFLSRDFALNHQLSAEKITVVSQYFLVETRVRIEDQELVLYTLLERKPSPNKIEVNTIWQSKTPI
jgi:general secretion pathway protein K